MHVHRADPRVRLGEPVEHRPQQLGLGLVPGHLLEAPHTFVVLDPLGLPLGDELTLLLVELAHQHRRRIFEDRLGEAHDVERVLGRRGVEGLERLDQEQPERLHDREVGLKVLCDVYLARSEVLGRPELQDLRLDEALEELAHAPPQRLLAAR